MTTKAIGLISGGLDSVLAVALLQKQNIEVIGLQIINGFSNVNLDNYKNFSAYKVSQKLNFQYLPVDISDEYWDILLYPKHGYGKNVNPCIDCHAFMFEVGKRIMKKMNADFVFTGEVLGQRPMSQMMPSLNIVEKQSGLIGKLLRPLSAQLLKPTDAENEGKVDRSLLKDFQGRNRTPQLELAKELGIENIADAGGTNCYLIDPYYAKKMKDVFQHIGKENLTKNDVEILSIGRQLRLDEKTKLIVSRDEEEYYKLLKFKKDNYYFEIKDYAGAIGIGIGDYNDEKLSFASQIIARYSKGKDEESVKLIIEKDNNFLKELSVQPISINSEKLKSLII